MEKVNANNSQLALNSNNINQSTANIDQLIQEFQNTTPPSNPETAKNYYQLQDITNSNQDTETKEKKLSDKLKSFSKKACQELYNFAVSTGANVLATYIQNQIRLS